ncbi:MAG: flagellar hook-length control protein FliK, partial [Spirochaetales bacterium]
RNQAALRAEQAREGAEQREAQLKKERVTNAGEGEELLKLKDSPLTANSADSAGRNVRTLTVTREQQPLPAQLKEFLNSDIVKNTGIILKDNNSGEIKLVLKPANLGRVRIELNLQDSHLAGRILVDNNMVKEIFEQNMSNLEQAFRDSGFLNLSLEVGVGNGKNGAGERDEFGGLVETADSARAGESVVMSYLAGYGDNLIDLVV